MNFGTAGFFALGAYTAVFFHKTYPLPIPVLLIIAAGVSGLIGFGTGYLTLRLRGAFFSIATLALAVVLQTFVVNWDYVGGSRGAYVIRPDSIDRLRLPDRLHPLSLPDHASARGSRGRDRAHDRAREARLRICHHPRRRTRRRGIGRADAQAQVDRDHAVGGADGHGRRAVPHTTSAMSSPPRPLACHTRSTRLPCR